jgi:hypothetical protein
MVELSPENLGWLITILVVVGFVGFVAVVAHWLQK